MNEKDILELDAKYCWHPFTQAKTALAPTVIVRGEGSYLYGPNGEQYFDAVSSWWVNIHGHAHPHIASAIAKQASELEHVMFAGITHPAAVRLAQRLIERAPKPMAKVFYSDNGSTAVEVALKMAFQYWSNQGKAEQRRGVIALDGGYHGDTFGAMSAGKSCGFYGPFSPWLFSVNFIPTGTCQATEQASLDALAGLLQANPEGFAALIIEPLIQGASGMRMMSPSYVAKICQLCRQFDVLVIFDEVMTGFGRTGTFYAAEQVAHAGGYADMICISKGLTGGFMPMAATLASECLYEAFLDDNVGKALLHGHSYTANPLGCAAALACLELFDQGDVWDQIRTIERVHANWLTKLSGNPSIAAVRQCGTVAAFDLTAPVNEYGSSASQWIRQAFFERGILARPLGNTMYWIPPYCTTEHTLNLAYEQLLDVLAQWRLRDQQASGSELF